MTIAVFLLFVGLTLGLSFYLGRQAKSPAGYFAAHGQIPWFINGIAFAGDYLSAASFLGICGMIAFYGYDGFLYSIGYLAGWIVALFIVAEPMKRLGKFTFADALNARFQSPGIRLAGGVSTLAVSLFYLIPQMVGAGTLVQPLLGLPHWAGVLLVGVIVMLIVVTAGMVSTTWVQFLKGTLLVVFSLVLTIMILNRGLSTNNPAAQTASTAGSTPYRFRQATIPAGAQTDLPAPFVAGAKVTAPPADLGTRAGDFLFVQEGDRTSVWKVTPSSPDSPADTVALTEGQYVFKATGQPPVVNGRSVTSGTAGDALERVGFVKSLPGDVTSTGPLNPWSFLTTLQNSTLELWGSETISKSLVIYLPRTATGDAVLRPGEYPALKGIRGDAWQGKINFVSLMLALFCGTASLPHILIRYYTVKDESSARKSTIVGIGSIGFFYVLTLYLGLGAMTSGALDVSDSNMAAPLLAKSMNEVLFAIISAIAFTTVLGTVSGLILASAGAVTHDLLGTLLRHPLTEHQQVRVAKFASVGIGALAIALGILFQKMNVSYLVGWAFSVAASANLPALVMLLFWKRTTRAGIIAAIVVGMVTSLGWILLSGDTYRDVYRWDPAASIIPFSQPGIVTIPLGFLTLIAVSLCTRPRTT